MSPLSFPVTESGVARVRLDIVRIDFASPEASGRQGGVQAGWPLWSAIYDIERCDPDSADMWSAFLARLRGRQRLFFAGDTTRSYPKSRPNGFAGMVRAGGGAFGGSALGWSQAIDADSNSVIGLTGLPAGLVLSQRDLIGFKWDAAGAPAGSHDRRTMTRVVSSAVASGGGGMTVMVEPPIDPLVVPPGAIAHLDLPCCTMRLIPDKTDMGPIGTGNAGGGGTITAVQELRA